MTVALSQCCTSAEAATRCPPDSCLLAQHEAGLRAYCISLVKRKVECIHLIDARATTASSIRSRLAAAAAVAAAAAGTAAAAAGTAASGRNQWQPLRRLAAAAVAAVSAAAVSAAAVFDRSHLGL